MDNRSLSITGQTAVYLIAGDPVAQVRAPEVFNLVFAHMGIDAVLVPVHVTAARLADFVRTVFSADNVKGMLLAIPHKAPAMPLLGRSSLLARATGAVNAIRLDADGQLCGGQFDGPGFVGALTYFGIACRGRSVLVLGAGGGASAIAASLAGAEGAQVALYDVDAAKARKVADGIRACFPDARVSAVTTNDPKGYSIVVNATPLGLQPSDVPPCDVMAIDAGASVIDIVMKNQPTALVRQARARGLVAHPGFEMLIQQTPHYLDFFGYEAAAKRVREDARFLRELIYPAALSAEVGRPFSIAHLTHAEAMK